MGYILWVAALQGACDVIQDGGHLGDHLGFCPKLEIIKRRKKLKIFDAGHIEYDQIKHFVAFYQRFVIYRLRRVRNTHFSSKMAYPPATYAVISRNHSNQFLPNSRQNVSERYAHSY